VKITEKDVLTSRLSKPGASQERPLILRLTWIHSRLREK